MNTPTDDQGNTEIEVIEVSDLIPARVGPIVPSSVEITISDLPSQSTQPYNSEKALDDARKYIAYMLIGLLMAICLGAMISTAIDANSEAIFRVLEHILSPIVGLVGAATGFYFGTRSKA